MRSDVPDSAYVLGGGIGLLLRGYAAQSSLWYGYLRANPDVGSLSTSPGFVVATAGIFLLGTVVAFSSFSRGLARVLDDADAAAEG